MIFSSSTNQTSEMFQDFLLLFESDTLHVWWSNGHLAIGCYLYLVDVQCSQG